MKLTPNQPIAKGNQSTFTCTAPADENFLITSYIWKLNDNHIPGENKEQYKFTPDRTHNGKKLSCTAVIVAGITSEESQVILQVFCKYLIQLFIH